MAPRDLLRAPGRNRRRVCEEGQPDLCRGSAPKYGTYVDKTTGVEKNSVDIIATEMQLLGGREGRGGRW